MRQMIISIRVLLFISMATIVACNNGNDRKKAPVAERHATVHEYQLFLDSLDLTNADNATLAAERYKTMFTYKDSLRNDSAYTLFEAYYDKLCFGLNENSVFDTILTSSVDSISLDSPGRSLPHLAQPFAVIRRNGFQLDEIDGYIAIVPDGEFAAKHFYLFITAAMRTYLERVKEESNNRAADEDNALIISATEVADRTIWWEHFVAAHPSFAYAVNAKESHQYYTTCLLRGLESTPAINPDTRAPDTTFIRAYQYVLREHPNTYTAKLVGPYYEALMDNNGRKADSITVQYKTQDLLLW